MAASKETKGDREAKEQVFFLVTDSNDLPAEKDNEFLEIIDFSSGFQFSKRCDMMGCLACSESFPTEPNMNRVARYSKGISQRRARKIITEHANSIDESFTKLCSLMLSKGDKIMTRWKKDKKRRQEVIREALPDSFPKEKWALISAYLQFVQGKVNDRAPSRLEFLLPYIGREELIEDPSKLLQLLDLRTRYQPWEWATIDRTATEYGRTTGMLNMRFNETMFSIEKDNYGSEVSYESDAFHRWKMVGFPIAEILFEAQCKLYTFLCTSVELLLKRAEDKDSGNALWTESSAKGFSDYAPPRQGLMERPFYDPVSVYDSPVRYDLETARMLSGEREIAAEIELGLLQTDISHAKREIEVLLKSHPFRGHDMTKSWSWVAFAVCEPLLRQARRWNRLETIWQQLEQQEQSGSVDSDKLEILLDWAYYLILVDVEARRPRGMYYSLLQNPSFDQNFPVGKVAPADEWKTRLAKVKAYMARQDAKQQSPETYKQEPLLWAISMLSLARANNWDWPNWHSLLNIIFPYLNDLAQSRKLNLESEHPRVVQSLVDFSATLQLRTSLEAHRPRFVQRSMRDRAQTLGKFREDFLDQHSTKEKVYWLAIYAEVESVEENKSLLKEYERAGTLLKEFWDLELPGPKRKRDLAWYEKVEQSKHALDAFWQEVREMKLNEVRETWEEDIALKSQEVAVLEYYQEPEFLTELQKARQAFEAAEREKEEEKQEREKQPKAKPSPKRLQESEWDTFRGAEKTSPKRPKTGSAKPPKRSHTIEEEDPTPVPARPPIPAPVPTPPQKIQVTRESLRTFSRLWPIQSGIFLDEGGTVRWNDFQRAMDDAEFRAVGVGGSKVSFESKSDKGSILIHGPHGPGNSPLKRKELSTYGRRLKKKWGWGYHTFVERKRGG